MTTLKLDQLTDYERLGLIWPLTDPLRMEAAMVIWEAALEQDGCPDGDLAALRDAVGAVQSRHLMMDLVTPLHIGWHVHERAAGADTLCPFDWEFTPWFLADCVEIDPELGAVSLRPDWLDRCRAARPRPAAA